MSEEIAYLTFDPNITKKTELLARWGLIMRQEMSGYLNKCIFRCDEEFLKSYPDYKLGEGVMILQEK